MQRRKMIQSLLAGTTIAAINISQAASCIDKRSPVMLKNNINHSVCRWTYNFLSLEELCVQAKKIGLKAIDLVGPADWQILRNYGLDSSMCNGAEINIPKGWNNPVHHSTLIKSYLDHIELVSKAGYKNLICFSGNRDGMDDETGLINCTEGLKKIMALAEKKDVIIQMELLNSKVDHKDYMADATAWGVELCKKIDSPNFKLLYDIYHMQINEGDIIRTIEDSQHYIGHYHTGGVPGRHEINESQELFYPAIMKSIVATGFKGYVAQEFIPAASDKIASLREAVTLCDV